jgi:transposase InsO family protein
LFQSVVGSKVCGAATGILCDGRRAQQVVYPVENCFDAVVPWQDHVSDAQATNAHGVIRLVVRQRRTRRRRVAEHGRERFQPTAPNQVWSMDFVADQLVDGRRFRSLTVLDIYTREFLAIESDQRLKCEDVVMVLNRIKIQRGVPKMLYCDNGSEFSSQAMDLWAYQKGVRIAFSRPGKPTDNAFVESFNGTFRAECLDATSLRR